MPSLSSISGSCTPTVKASPRTMPRRCAGTASPPSRGNATAQLNLGVMYAKGEGVPEDAVNAYAWFSIAAAQGDTRAKENKELVASRMTRSQIAEAQALSRKYWALYVLPFQ